MSATSSESAQPVYFYQGPWYMLSNFAAFAVLWRNVLWPTSEHAYQAAKFDDVEIQIEIRLATSPHTAKLIANKYLGRRLPDWDSHRLAIMEEILRAKLDQHEIIQERLLRAAGRVIIEDSPIDPFWGRGRDYNGLNHLGKIWMKLCDELVEQKRLHDPPPFDSST